MVEQDTNKDDASNAKHQQVGGDVLEAVKGARINILLESKPHELLKLTPRRYQTELCQKSLERNVIIYLGTGLGKTYITVLFLRSPQISSQIHQKRKVIFLTPTQDLTRQQAEYIHMFVPYRVKVYCGRTCDLGKHIDHWSKTEWTKELESIDILVMTPQIFSSAVGSNLIDWTSLSALILDECHHAVSKKAHSKHPYSELLKHYENYYRVNPGEQKPRIVGLTASLVNNMPSNPDDIFKGIQKLEQRLDAICVTDLEVQETKPKMVIHSFCDVQLDDTDMICSKLSNYARDMKLTLELSKIKQLEYKVPSKLTNEDALMLSYYNKLKLSAMGISLKPSSFSKVLEHLIRIRKRCGLWTLREICGLLIVSVEKHTTSKIISSDLKPVYIYFTELLKQLSEAISNLIHNGSLSDELLSYTQPRCTALLDVLKEEYDRTIDGTSGKSCFSCIVFVHSRLEVVVLNRWLKTVSSSIPMFSFIKSDYAIGLAAASSSKYACFIKRKSNEQAKILSDFRRGLLNVIVTTSVLEEGIDLPVCSTVIRYDPAMTFRVYVQSRGRAREKISSYITMCERRNATETQTQLQKLNDFETRVKTLFSEERNIASQTRESTNFITDKRQQSLESLPLQQRMFMSDHFTTNDGKIYMSATNVRIILFMYCSRLAHKHPFTDGIRYDCIKTSVGLFLTTLYMPPGCPIQHGVQGNEKAYESLALDSAIIAAYTALYDMGEFNENGIPNRLTPESADQLLTSAGLMPIYEDLNPFYAGKAIDHEGRELVVFDPALYKPVDFLSRNYLEKTYKLLRIKFIPIEGQVRQDTQRYFERRRLGLVIDSSMSCMLPKALHGHYGNYKLELEEISANYKILRNQDHTDLLNYTHKMLTLCLSIGRVPKEEFKRNCLFYMLILTEK
ncbi:endoribonuclease Dicer homolog 2-like [Tasmannia lanceolata]|uniref:endoribonuclease Dicer homolog 2-like n=1 Tax=Tasmannia lanceolata TaxID=3420 RepID=UPI004064063A